MWYVYAYTPLTGDPSTSVPLITQGEKYGSSFLGGPFATKADAETWIKGPGAQWFGKGKTNIAPPIDVPVTAGIPGPEGKSPLQGLAAIGDFFQRLTQASTWIRVGQVLLGLILIAAGTARITRAIPAATRVAAAIGTKGLA